MMSWASCSSPVSVVHRQCDLAPRVSQIEAQPGQCLGLLHSHPQQGEMLSQAQSIEVPSALYPVWLHCRLLQFEQEARVQRFRLDLDSIWERSIPVGLACMI